MIMKKKLNKLLSLISLFLIVACTQVPGIFVGRGTAGYIDEVGINAEFNEPTGLCIDNSGNLFVADSKNRLIRKVTPEGKVSTFAGVKGDKSVLSCPFDCDFDSKGELYVSNDDINAKINKITPDGKVSVFAGGGDIENFYKEEVPASQINLSGLSGIAIDSKDNIYALFHGSLPSSTAKISQDNKALRESSDTINGQSNYFITINKEKDDFYFIRRPSPFPSNLLKRSLITKELMLLPANNNSIFEIPFWKTFGKPFSEYDSYRAFRSITLDKEGNIYIVNVLKPYGILKILKDETTVNVITELSDRDMIDSLTDLAIDNKRNILYFSSPKRNKVYKILLK